MSFVASRAEAGVRKGSEVTAGQRFGHCHRSMCDHHCSPSGHSLGSRQDCALLSERKISVCLWISGSLEIPCQTRNIEFRAVSLPFARLLRHKYLNQKFMFCVMEKLQVSVGLLALQFCSSIMARSDTSDLSCFINGT